MAIQRGQFLLLDPNGPLVRRVESSQNVQQSRFAGPTHAEDGDELAFFDPQIHLSQSVNFGWADAVMPGKATSFNKRKAVEQIGHFGERDNDVGSGAAIYSMMLLEDRRPVPFFIIFGKKLRRTG